MHLNGIFLKSGFFLKTVESKVNILTSYVLPIVAMAINKFQRSRLTFQPRSLIDGPIELNFHMKTPYEKLAKLYT